MENCGCEAQQTAATRMLEMLLAMTLDIGQRIPFEIQNETNLLATSPVHTTNYHIPDQVASFVKLGT